MAAAPVEDGAAIERARELVLAHGWNAACFQIVNPGIDYWFSEAGDAVVGFVRRRGVRVVVGAPACPKERLESVVAEWERDASGDGERVCYLGAAGRMLGVTRRAGGYSLVTLGSQPNWDPQHWPTIIAAHAPLRAQLNRARNKKVRVREIIPEDAALSRDLRRCLDEWLAARPLPPLHFMVETQTLTRLAGRRIFAAEQEGAGTAGFLIASPVPRRYGWLFEQIIRCPSAPNGTAELLIDSAMRRVAEDGARYATLGMVPLSRRAPESSLGRNPLWLRGLLAWVRAHGRRFWSFEGQEAFKAKFQPESWEPLFAVANEARFTPNTLLAIAEAFSDEAATALLSRAFGGALHQELRWLLERAGRRSGTIAPETVSSASRGRA